MKKILLLVIWSVLMSSCVDSDWLFKYTLNEAVEALTPLSSKYKMKVSGGGGYLGYDIGHIALSVNIYKQVTVEEARRIYVEILDAIVERINKDKKLRPYLREYPMTYNLIKLSLTFLDEKTHYPPKEYVYYMYKHDILFFDGYHIVKDDFVDLHREDFSETLEILQKEKESQR